MHAEDEHDRPCSRVPQVTDGLGVNSPSHPTQTGLGRQDVAPPQDALYESAVSSTTCSRYAELEGLIAAIGKLATPGRHYQTLRHVVSAIESVDASETIAADTGAGVFGAQARGES